MTPIRTHPTRVGLRILVIRRVGIGTIKAGLTIIRVPILAP